jgi:stage V sporulation protein R
MSYVNEENKMGTSIENYVEQRTPDIPMSPATIIKFNEVIAACKKAGLDGYDFIYEFFTWDEISEIAAYGGFPVRYPHYLFGMEYEHMNRSYQYGYSKIYEMVIANNPCYAYLLNSNSEVDNLTVIAHAYAHNDFMKNNKWFGHINTNMMNEMASHGTTIRRYCLQYGRDKVIRFLDLALSIQFLINHEEAYTPIKCKHEQWTDKVETITEEPHKILVKEDHEYMEQFVNPKDFVQGERDRIKKDFKKKTNAFPEKPTRDVLGFLSKSSPRLRSWMKDILCMIKEESLYFLPIIQTQIMNEGWASFWDMQIMAKGGFAGDEGIIDYASHHAGVIGGKYSRNPYAVGSLLFRYIKDRWDKGKFGQEWDDCKDRKIRKEWDKKTGLGMQKIFEVRELYNDFMFINEFMDQDFCDDNEFYVYEKNKKGEYILISRKVEDVKEQILKNVGLQRFPIIRVNNANALNLGHLHLEHVWTGRMISVKYAKETLKFIARLWGRPVVLTTYETDKSYDPRIPMEINNKIMPVCFFSKTGYDVNPCSWNEYKDYFLHTKPAEEGVSGTTGPQQP